MISSNMHELWNISTTCAEKTFGDLNVSVRIKRVDGLSSVALKKTQEVNEGAREIYI